MSTGLRFGNQRPKSAAGRISQFIEQAWLEQRLDPWLVQAIIQVESTWNVRARSKKGAMGLMQLMSDTASPFGVHDSFDALKDAEVKPSINAL